MIDPRLAALIEHTYSRATLAYRIGVLKEFLEFMFYTSHSTKVTDEVTEAFEKKGHAVADIEFLRSLPSTFFDSFTRESFYKDMEQFAADAQKLPSIALTTSVLLDASNRDRVGAWVRKELGNDVLIDLSTDPRVAVGCQIVWKNQLHDFGLDHYLDQHREEIEEKISRVIPRAPLFGKLHT